MLSLAAFTAVCPATAQTALTDSIAGERLLDTVTVTASADKKEIRATMPVRSIGGSDMLRLGVTDIADALNRLPGVTLRDYGGAGGMKTVAVRGMGAGHTGVSYDGIALSDCQTGEIDVSRYSTDMGTGITLTVGDGDDIFIPARNAAHAAMLAIMPIRPKTADRRPHLETRLKVGSFGYVSPAVNYRQNIGSGLTLDAAGEYVYAENDYPYTLYNGTATVRRKRTNSRMNSARAEAGATWRGTRAEASGRIYYYDNDRLLPGQVRYYTDMSDERLRERNAFAQARFRTWNSRGLAVKAAAKFSWAASDYKNGAYPDGVNDAAYRQREVYTTASLLYAPTTKWGIAYSADYMFNNLNSSLPTDTRPLRHTILQTAAFRYTAERFKVTARLLYSLYINDAKTGPAGRNMRRLSPSAGISYRLLKREELYIRLSYKNIFRAPNFNETYFYHYGSTDLLPENTDQINLGLAWSHACGSRSRFSLTADGYINRVKDKIVAVPYNMFVWTNINVGRVKGHGIETEATFNSRINRWLTILATVNYTWQRCRNMTNSESPYYGYQIAYIPEHQGSAAVSLESPWINLSIHGHGMSHRYTNNQHYDGTRIDGYAETGITVWRKFRLWRGELEVRADVKNLLDKQYEIVAHYPMPGRSYQISMKYKF